MNLQVFGTKKDSDTRKAERWFRERKVTFQLIDLGEKGISAGELRAVIGAVGRDALLDTEGKRYRERGLAWQEFDLEAEILADPLLLKMPIVRDGRRATTGYQPETWAEWLRSPA
jgi:arsenate reductase (glutaredoxin)